MIWFEAPLSLLYRDLGALEVLSIHSFNAKSGLKGLRSIDLMFAQPRQP